MIYFEMGRCPFDAYQEPVIGVLGAGCVLLFGLEKTEKITALEHKEDKKLEYLKSRAFFRVFPAFPLSVVLPYIGLVQKGRDVQFLHNRNNLFLGIEVLLFNLTFI